MSISIELNNHWIKSISFEKADVGKTNTISDYSIGHFKPIVSDR